MKANPAKAVAVTVGRLGWDEICKRHPDEWVVLVDADWTNDRDFAFGSALVVGHSKSRRGASADVKAAFKRHNEVGCFWTGEIRGPTPRFSVP